jgi:hypothetical protein
LVDDMQLAMSSSHGLNSRNVTFSKSDSTKQFVFGSQQFRHVALTVELIFEKLN